MFIGFSLCFDLLSYMYVCLGRCMFIMYRFFPFFVASNKLLFISLFFLFSIWYSVWFFLLLFFIFIFKGRCSFCFMIVVVVVLLLFCLLSCNIRKYFIFFLVVSYTVFSIYCHSIYSLVWYFSFSLFYIFYVLFSFRLPVHLQRHLIIIILFSHFY